MKRNKSNRITTGILILILIGVCILSGGCGRIAEKQPEINDPIMKLVDQSTFFDKAPEKLAFGNVVQETDSDQGVSLQYLASFFDGEAVYIFFELTDTGAGLFSEGGNGNDFSLESYDFLEKAGYNDSKLYHLMSYDEKSRTATICAEYIGPLKTDDLSFHIYSMTGNQKLINTAIENIDLYEMLQRSKGDFEKETEHGSYSTGYGFPESQADLFDTTPPPEFKEGCNSDFFRLKRDVTALPVTDEEGNHIGDITNIGWRDGWLHVQLNPKDDIDLTGSFYLKNNKTGKLSVSPFHIGFGTDRNGKPFKDYFEYVFYVGDFTEENLDRTIAFHNTEYRAVSLTGDWDLKFTIPESLLKRLEADKGVPVNGGQLTIRRAVISPVNITLFASAKDVSEEQMDWFDNIENNALRMKIIYQDGKTAMVPEVAANSIRNQKGLLFRTVFNPERFDEITGMEINGILFPVKGE